MSLLFINLLIGFDGLTLNLGPDITWQWFAALIWAISEGTIGMKSGASATFKIMNRYCTIAPPCASQISTIYSDAMFVLEKIIWRLKLSRPRTESTGLQVQPVLMKHPWTIIKWLLFSQFTLTEVNKNCAFFQNNKKLFKTWNVTTMNYHMIACTWLDHGRETIIFKVK